MDGKTVTKTVTVEDDPRIPLSAEDRTRRHEAIMKLYGMAREADSGRRRIAALRTSLTQLTDGWKRPGAPPPPEAVRKAAEDLLARVKEVIGTFETDRPGQLGSAGPPLKYTPPPVNQKITRLMFALDSFTGAPTARQLDDIEQASATLKEGLAAVNKLTGEDLPRLNKLMSDSGVPYVTAQ